MACCPAHEDQHESLSLDIGGEGRLLIKCHANHGCTFASIVAALGLEETDFFPESTVPRKAIATYSYQDERGKLLYQVVRFEPKGFAQRRPIGEDDEGRPTFEWGLGDTRRVLYNLPALVKAGGKRKVLVVEGEKDVETLRKMDLLATSNSAGAGKWPECECECLRGCHVVVIADNDGPGKEHALDIATKLFSIASSVKLVLRLPDVPEKEDVTWWMQHGGTREKLIELIEQTPVWQPETKPEAKQEARPDKQAEAKTEAKTEPTSDTKSEGASDVETIMRQAERLAPKDLVWLVRSLLVCVERVVP